MRFQVPQFINIEDKLFGPFTFKQSIYLVGGAGMVFLIYRSLPFFVVIVLGLPVILFTLALVFYKPNGRPFVSMVEAFILYLFTNKFFLWRKKDEPIGATSVEQVHAKFPLKGEVLDQGEGQKISDLAWSLDVLDLDQ